MKTAFWGRPGPADGVSAQWDSLGTRSQRGCSVTRQAPGQGQLWLQTDSHPQRLQYPQLPPGCITKVSRQKHFGCLKYGLHTILRLYFTSSFSNTQARFYGIWGILLNDLVVHCWPDRAFPDLDYKRKTASGKFSCRSMDTCTTQFPPQALGPFIPGGRILSSTLDRDGPGWLLLWLLVPFAQGLCCYHIVNIVLNIKERLGGVSRSSMQKL